VSKRLSRLVFGDAIALVFRVACEFILQNFLTSANLVAFPDIGTA
jgi:hypothetical protein